jgi:uncharacterized protein (DUF433 family)
MVRFERCTGGTIGTVGEFWGFTAEQVGELTGLSPSQLRRWDRDGFFAPEYADEERRRPYSRVYSFRDLVGLRTLARLRNEYKIPRQELKRLGEWLSQRHEAPWSSLRFYVGGKKVYFDDPERKGRVLARETRRVWRKAKHTSEQAAFPIEMKDIAEEMANKAQKLRERSDSEIGKITRHRYIVHNAPVIAGTRVPTSAIWNFHRAGYDAQAIIREYPRLTPEDIRAAIAFEEERQPKKVG